MRQNRIKPNHPTRERTNARHDTKAHTHLHLLGHTHADGGLDDGEEDHARQTDPSDHAEDEHNVRADSVTVSSVEGAGTLVTAIVVISPAVCAAPKDKESNPKTRQARNGNVG